MTDKELLELAAKAAGIEYHSYYEDKFYGWGINIGEVDVPLWNPLTDDGDALRLAVKLGIAIELHPAWVYARAVLPSDHLKWMEITEGWGNGGDQHAATRRAIVRAAAEIGKAA